MFDPRSRPVYALIAVAGVLELAILLLTDFTFDNRVFLRLFVSLLALLGAGLIARRYGMPRIATALEMLALPGISGAMISTGTFTATAVSRPFADAWLSAADQVLGFNWVSLFELYQRHPELVTLSRQAYTSLFAQLPLIPLALVACGRAERAWAFITACAGAGVACAVIHPFSRRPGLT